MFRVRGFWVSRFGVSVSWFRGSWFRLRGFAVQGVAVRDFRGSTFGVRGFVVRCSGFRVQVVALRVSVSGSGFVGFALGVGFGCFVV